MPVSRSVRNLPINTLYSAAALLAMQIAIIARPFPSVCPSVCPSDTYRYSVQTNEDTIVPFSACLRTIPVVSGEAKFIRTFSGDHPVRRLKLRYHRLGGSPNLLYKP